jgi:hypothetical protein
MTVLLPILTWSLKRHGTTSVVQQWVDFKRIPRQGNREARLRTALELYPCDVLFVHRDAEGQPSDWRRDEIANSLKHIAIRHVPVVPVRMTEAWLLADEKAIRSAAGNPNGTDSLSLPDVWRLEDVPDPKKVLHDAPVTASGLNARRRFRFPTRNRIRLIPNYIDDYSRLNVLPAFSALQQDIRALVKTLS